MERLWEVENRFQERLNAGMTEYDRNARIMNNIDTLLTAAMDIQAIFGGSEIVVERLRIAKETGKFPPGESIKMRTERNSAARDAYIDYKMHLKGVRPLFGVGNRVKWDTYIGTVIEIIVDPDNLAISYRVERDGTESKFVCDENRLGGI